VSGVWLVVGITGVMALAGCAWLVARSFGAGPDPDTDEHPVVESIPDKLSEAAKLPRSRASLAIDELGATSKAEWWRQGVLWHDAESRPVAPPRFYDQERRYAWQ